MAKGCWSFKINKKPKKKPQPISVNVDVTDSRELHYEMPGAPGIISTKKNTTDELRDLLNKMSISEEARKEMKQELGKMDGKIEGGPSKNVQGSSLALKKAEQGKPAKFSELLKGSSKKYVAYNEDDYGDFEKALKKEGKK